MKVTPLTTAVLVACLTPLSVQALEFQRIGKLGTGGAGVATSNDSLAAYWNPAGLAFTKTKFSARVGAGFGANVSESLTDSVDRIGDMDLEDLQDLTFSGSTAQNALASSQAVEFIGIANTLYKDKGYLTASVTSATAFQYQGFAIGMFGMSEVGAYSITDITNIRPGFSDGSTTPVQFGFGIGALDLSGNPLVTTPGTLFTSDQRTAIESAFAASGATTGQASAIVNTLEAQFQASGGNKSQQSSQQLTDAMILMASSFTSGDSIENNTTEVKFRGIVIGDVPVAYGHSFNMGAFGTLGVGGAVKAMIGRAYAYTQNIVDIEDSDDLAEKMTESYEDSINVGVDLGMLWRYNDMLSIGVVGKNLNSPKFDLPSENGGASTGRITVKPQIRMGMAIDPTSWLTLAADIDLTDNETAIGDKNRTVGGGLDIHPVSWLSLRGGAYTNLSNSDTGPVGTAGFSLGPDAFRFNIDGAMAFKTGRFDEKDYPREARVEFSLSTLF